jgi:hypothetical protein
MQTCKQNLIFNVNILKIWYKFQISNLKSKWSMFKSKKKIDYKNDFKWKCLPFFNQNVFFLGWILESS